MPTYPLRIYDLDGKITTNNISVLQDIFPFMDIISTKQGLLLSLAIMNAAAIAISLLESSRGSDSNDSPIAWIRKQWDLLKPSGRTVSSAILTDRNTQDSDQPQMNTLLSSQHEKVTNSNPIPFQLPITITSGDRTIMLTESCLANLRISHKSVGTSETCSVGTNTDDTLWMKSDYTSPTTTNAVTADHSPKDRSHSEKLPIVNLKTIVPHHSVHIPIPADRADCNVVEFAENCFHLPKLEQPLDNCEQAARPGKSAMISTYELIDSFNTKIVPVIERFNEKVSLAAHLESSLGICTTKLVDALNSAMCPTVNKVVMNSASQSNCVTRPNAFCNNFTQQSENVPVFKFKNIDMLKGIEMKSRLQGFLHKMKTNPGGKKKKRLCKKLAWNRNKMNIKKISASKKSVRYEFAESCSPEVTTREKQNVSKQMESFLSSPQSKLEEIEQSLSVEETVIRETTSEVKFEPGCSDILNETPTANRDSFGHDQSDLLGDVPSSIMRSVCKKHGSSLPNCLKEVGPSMPHSHCKTFICNTVSEVKFEPVNGDIISDTHFDNNTSEQYQTYHLNDEPSPKLQSVQSKNKFSSQQATEEFQPLADNQRIIFDTECKVKFESEFSDASSDAIISNNSLGLNQCLHLQSVAAPRMPTTCDDKAQAISLISNRAHFDFATFLDKIKSLFSLETNEDVPILSLSIEDIWQKMEMNETGRDTEEQLCLMILKMFEAWSDTHVSSILAAGSSIFSHTSSMIEPVTPSECTSAETNREHLAPINVLSLCCFQDSSGSNLESTQSAITCADLTNVFSGTPSFSLNSSQNCLDSPCPDKADDSFPSVNCLPCTARVSCQQHEGLCAIKGILHDLIEEATLKSEWPKELEVMTSELPLNMCAKQNLEFPLGNAKVGDSLQTKAVANNKSAENYNHIHERVHIIEDQPSLFISNLCPISEPEDLSSNSHLDWCSSNESFHSGKQNYSSEDDYVECELNVKLSTINEECGRAGRNIKTMNVFPSMVTVDTERSNKTTDVDTSSKQSLELNLPSGDGTELRRCEGFLDWDKQPRNLDWSEDDLESTSEWGSLTSTEESLSSTAMAQDVKKKKKKWHSRFLSSFRKKRHQTPKSELSQTQPSKAQSSSAIKAPLPPVEKISIH